MIVQEIYFEDNAFGQLVKDWIAKFGIEPKPFESRATFDIELADALVVFHAYHDISKRHHALIDLFELHQKGVNKIDMNGTLSVAKSNFELWLERNKYKRILIVGEADLSTNTNVERFLNEINIL